MSEEFEYNRITGGLLIEMEEAYMLDYAKSIQDIAIRFQVSPESLWRFASKQSWKKKRDAFIQEKSGEIREKIQKAIGTTRDEAAEREILRQLLTKYKHEMMFRAMDRAITAHLDSHIDEETGSETPPAVDTISKLGPILIKRAEHELRKQGHAEFTQNNRSKPDADPSDPPVDGGEVSNALQRLEEQPDGSSEGNSSEGN